MTQYKSSSNSKAKWRFQPATAARWPDVERLFGANGACGGCWCMVWRRTPTEWKAGKSGGNRRALEQLVTDGAEPGIMAYAGRTPIGWCAVAPRADYPYLARSRVLKPVDAQPVWSISCLFIHKDYRRQGLSSELVAAAARFAIQRGAHVVEAYPVVPYSDRAPPPFLWTGTVSTFERAGFIEAARHSPNRPILRFVADQGS